MRLCDSGYGPIASTCEEDRRLEPALPEDAEAYSPLNIESLSEASAELAEGLKSASIAGDALQVLALLRRQADVNHRYNAGLTPLHFAALHNQCQAVRALIHGGADVFAETEDGLSPGVLAEMEGHKEVVQIICDHPPVKSPLRRRFLGPSIITFFVLLNAIVATTLVLRPWLRAGASAAVIAAEQGSVPVWFMALGYSFAAVAITSLILTNALDPGTVQRHAVKFVKELHDMSAESRVDYDEDGLGHVDVLPSDRRADGYRWCRSCELWKPPNVSHCAECKRCFWRFDHHCAAAGNCIAARNHRYFASLLMSGALAWLSGMVCVALKLNAVDAESSSSPRPWEHQAAIAYLIVGFVGVTPLALFATFHTSSLLFNFNTKMVLRPHKKNMEYSRLNNEQDFGLLFTMPWEWRASGTPTPIEPRYDSRTEG